MFTLCCADVLLLTDLGIEKELRSYIIFKGVPTPKQMMEK